MPTLTYGSDEGFGTGGVGTLYFLEEGIAPYKAALTLNIFVTDRLIHRHRVRLDTLRIGGLPLRLFAQIGVESTLTQNFCGYGNDVTCGSDEAHQAATDAGEQPGTDAYESLVSRHHLMRFVRPYGEVLLRYALWDKPHRLEFWAGGRGNYYLPGAFAPGEGGEGPVFEEGPFAHSRWAKLRPGGERGFSGVVQAGVALDDRDEEVQPNRGYFVEASLRAASRLWGSDWEWWGGHSSAALYAPLWRAGGADLVLAERLLADLSFGDVPTEDMARLGGLSDFIAMGGSDVGRGIREHRYLGKIKVVYQGELRLSLGELDLVGEHFKVGVASFLDVAWLGYDVRDWRGRALGLVGGGGVGLRLLWNQNFTVRLDVGVSPAEAFEPRVYIRVGNPF